MKCVKFVKQAHGWNEGEVVRTILADKLVKHGWAVFARKEDWKQQGRKVW